MGTRFWNCVDTLMNMAPIFLRNSLAVGYVCQQRSSWCSPRCSGVTPLETLERIQPRHHGNGTSADDDRMQVDSLKKGKREGQR